jgi:hypothetical protein
MYGHRSSFLASCAAPCGGLPSLTRQAGPGNAVNPDSQQVEITAGKAGQHCDEGVRPIYRANSIARDSRITVTRIWPG